MHVENVSRRRFLTTALWAFLASTVIVIAAAALGRAALNLRAAVTDKPDIGIYLLLPEEGIHEVTLLRSTDTQRDYLVETKEGPKLVKLQKGEDQWEVGLVEKLHE